MAEIPVEKKSSSLWWLWLLVLIVIAALIWWWVAETNDNDVDTVAVAPVPALVADDTQIMPNAEPASPNDTNALAMLTSGQITGMVGQEVHLQGAPVESLAGDMAFYIGSNAADRVLVAFDQVPTPGTAKEGLIDVNPGSRVDIDGVVRSTSEPLPAGANFTPPAGTAAYIFASDVNVVN